MSSDTEGDEIEPRRPAGQVGAALEALLGAHPAALVAAVGPEGRLVPVPATVPVNGHRTLASRSAMDLVDASDRLVIIDAWARAAEEPVVTFDVHLHVAPEQPATVHLLDVRAEHGVHMIVVLARDPELVLAMAEASAALPTGGVAHIRKNATAVILAADAATTALLGWPAGALEGVRTVELIHPDDVERAVEAWMEMRAGADSTRVQLRHRHANGHYVWVEVTNLNCLDDPDEGCIISELVDISVQMAEVEALRDRERLLGRLAEALPIGVCHVRPDRAVAYSNALLLALLGPIDSVGALIRSVARADRDAVAQALDAALEGHPSHLEVGVLHGLEERRCELTFRVMASDSGSDGVIVCAADVTDRSRLRAELEHRASHDTLSGCLNRAAIVATLDRALRLSEEVAVVYADLDNLKVVNDELGHAAGDELLRVAAARLRSAARSDDRIGRIGGDEFVVVCQRGDGPFDAQDLVERFSEAIEGDVTFARQRVALRASVGASISRPGEVDAEAVLVRADAAMYEAKRRSRSRVVQLRAVTGDDR